MKLTSSSTQRTSQRAHQGLSVQGWTAAATVLLVLSMSVEILGRAPSARAVDLRGYRLTFAEEFNSLSVSAWGPGTRWIAHTPWNGDFGDAKFADPTPSFPFTVSRSQLRIEARRFSDGKWRSGLLASVDRAGKGFAQQFGYFEMRAKLPAGPGLWPAFWLIGRRGEEHTAEVDVLEHYGKFPERYTAAVHVWNRKTPAKNRSIYSRISVTPGSLYSDFHIYAVSVEADFIRFFLDNKEVWKVRTPEEHRQPLYILLDLGLGGGWPIDKAPSPAYMLVDYVRAWSRI